ncbi:TonB-dependent receptor plug domain-containing protein [Petrimonas sp.]|uniref:TonB-dependent receptor plug domain-containing protein n=1 Tax=Petrimonas sp. TaxID=2023866 RepID=UPI002FCC4099
MIKKLILITLVFLFPVLVFSQNIIQGLIVDVNNEPLIGVNVVVKGETIGTISDIDGRYSIETEHGKTLLFSYIGFETIEIEVTSNIINVILKENITTLDEVVAIGYGTIKNSRITGALSRVDSDQIDKRPVARLDQAIQGKIPGVYVQETSGSPGRSLNVRVRGIGSINYGTAPLYVVDGYPISGDLNSITPSDIASIEVLKDAASAAIYGSRGSNGVVFYSPFVRPLGLVFKFSSLPL